MAEVAELFLFHVDEFLETFIGESESDSDSTAEEEDFMPAMFYPCHDHDHDHHDPYPQTLEVEFSHSFVADPDMGSDYLGLGHDSSHEFFPSSDPLRPFDSRLRASGDGDGGLRIAGFDSDSDPESEIEALRWDCLRIDPDEVGDNPGIDPAAEAEAEEFEWEEVAPERHMEDQQQDLMRMLAVEEELDLDVLLSRSEVTWEVLMAEGAVEEEEDPGQISEYEVLASQIDSAIRCGNPPAAKGVVESLPTVTLTLTAEKDEVTCAICKDEMAAEEKVTKLPCGHFYHKDCILPWLKIRNSCPVCRFELPTDDPEYENWKDRRRGQQGNGSAGEGLVELLDRLDLDWAV